MCVEGALVVLLKTRHIMCTDVSPDIGPISFLSCMVHMNPLGAMAPMNGMSSEFCKPLTV